MSDQIEEDIEFIPSDDITEAEPVGPEDDALHIQEGEQSDEPTAGEAAEAEASQSICNRSTPTERRRRTSNTRRT